MTAAESPGEEQPATLVAFTLLWGLLQAAHFAKDLHSDVASVKPLPAACLLLVLPSVVEPRAAAALPLAAWGSTVYLLLYGSRSNHIVQDLLINLAIILAAAPGITVSRRHLRSLGSAAHYYLVVLYFISALHKLNSDWFDTSVSCASSVTAGLLAQYAPSLLAPASEEVKTLMWLSPIGAVALELVLPLMFVAAGPPGAVPQQGSELCRRLAVITGALFHLMLALPLPPSSFYPFSASCLSVYVLEVPGALDAVSAAVARRLPTLRRVAFPFIVPATSVGVLAVANASHFWARWVRNGEGSEAPFEYPPYDLYDAGVCWNVALAALLACAAALAPSLASSGSAGRLGCSGLMATLACSGGALSVGLQPYLGMRTYPAYAMFSNLRVEGARPNHMFLGGGLDVFGFQADSVRVLDTNASVLQSFQVDLAVLFLPSTRAFISGAGVQPALWICPPKWPHAPPASFVPFSAPAVALHQRLLAAERSGQQFYARVARGGREFIVRGSADLEVPCKPGVPAWACELGKRLAGPYRAFDEDRSPCRH